MYVPIDEADERLDELVDLALAGEEVILTRDGRPVIRVSPVGAGVEPPDLDEAR